MRDLGVDHQAARVRRIPVMKRRLHKATQWKIKLRNLKTPALRIRLRLHRGGIQPVAIWGVEGQGLALRYRTALRHALAKHLGPQHPGCHIRYIHSNKYMDPADQVIIHHVRAMHQLIQAWPEDQWQHLGQAWANTKPYNKSNTIGTRYEDLWQPPLPTCKNGTGTPTISCTGPGRKPSFC